MKLELGKELGQRIDRLMHPQSGAVTNAIRDAYESFSPRDSTHNFALHIFDKRIGKERVGTSIDSHGVHIHHYVYYYDWADPSNPNLRWGIEGEGNKVKFYSLESKDGKPLLAYYHRVTTDEAMHYLESMPRGNGNLIGVKNLQ